MPRRYNQACTVLNQSRLLCNRTSVADSAGKSNANERDRPERVNTQQHVCSSSHEHVTTMNCGGVIVMLVKAGVMIITRHLLLM